MLRNIGMQHWNSNGKWAIFHLFSDYFPTIFRLVSDRIKRENKKISQPELIPVAGFKSTLRYLLIKFVLNSPIKVKAPKGVDNVPEVTTIEQIKQGVNKNLQALEEFINRYPVELNQKAIFKHPLAGRINLYQTIQFLNDHLMHHDRQIRQIISKLHWLLPEMH